MYKILVLLILLCSCSNNITEEDIRQEEKNIKTTLLLDPKNEQAMFLLIDMELERSNFSKADELSKDFKKICEDMCEKIPSIESRLKDFERKDAS